MPYTLADCFRVESTSILFSREHGSEVIFANRILRGALFEGGEPLEATGVSFGTKHLVDWVMKTGISEEWTIRDDGAPLTHEPRYVLEARNLPDASTTLSNGISVTLRHGVGIKGDLRTERSLTHGCWWRIDLPSMTSFDEIVDLASDIQDLVSIAVDQPAAFEFMRFAHPDVVHKFAGGDKVPAPIDLYVRWNVQAKSNPSLHEHDFLFTFEQLGGIEGVGRWLEAAETHRGSLGRVMASRYADTMFVSDRLLNCAAALESFDRHRTNTTNSKFKTRLKRCAGFAGPVFSALVGDISAWAEAIRGERNDVAHNLGLRSRTANTETYYLWQSLYWLFVLCMLKECNAPAAVFQHLTTHAEYVGMTERIPGFINA